MEATLRLESPWQPYALSLLRFVVGLCFLQHGLSKLVGFPVVASLPAHLPPVEVIAGFIETIGGVLVVLGLLTRPAAFIMSGEMAVGYFMIHNPRSFFPLLNGGEAAVLFCFVFLYLATAGGGPISLDRLIASRRAAPARF
ncbi:MAG: DoxX family protein [Acetobacteraceae bacterium]